MLAYYRDLALALAPDVTLELVAVGSEGAVSREVAERHGVLYLEHPNQPLGAKWNAGLAALEARDVEAVVVVGSDDLVQPELLRLYAEHLRRGARFVGLLDAYFLDLPAWQLFYWEGYSWARLGESGGLGRCIARPWLEAVGWRLWDGELERGLDRSMEARLTPLMRAAPRTVELLHARDHGMVPLDIKTSTNLWSMQQVADSAPLRPVPFALLEDTYPALVVAGLATLRGARAAPEASSRRSIGGSNPVVTAQRLAGSPAWSVRFAIGPARAGG